MSADCRSHNSPPARQVAAIVPVAAGETSWRRLLGDFQALPPSAEVILVGVEAPPPDWADLRRRTTLNCPVRWISTAAGRARQLNCGAAHTSADHLWFVHADSRLGGEAIQTLLRALSRSREFIYFFDLKFQPDGPILTRINALGANFRSRWLGLPFGDQGLCLPRAVFMRLGGFDERVAYGEDHLLIWSARRVGIPVSRLGATMTTSARKYRRRGWLRTSAMHVWRTAKQAGPGLTRLALDRIGGRAGRVRRRKSRLIIFARCPDPGRCKTRLIPTLGAERATALYEDLVQRTMIWATDLAQSCTVEVEVQFTGNSLERLMSLCGMLAERLRFRQQACGDLGARLASAAQCAFDDGCSRIAIIGTDCPALDDRIVRRAFDRLEDHDVVLGPAADGGYYLIALRSPCPDLFEGISWGETTVFQSTLARASSLGLTTDLLPTLVDIDRPEDLHEWGPGDGEQEGRPSRDKAGRSGALAEAIPPPASA